MRSGVSDETLAELVIALRDEDRLCLVHEEDEHQEQKIVSSLDLLEAAALHHTGFLYLTLIRYL